jgi:hypothetical protein
MTQSVPPPETDPIASLKTEDFMALLKARAPQPSESSPARESAFASLQGIQWRAIESLAEVLEEPYTGEQSADSNIRKAKIAASSALLSVDTKFLREARRKA